jgi:hypothetical protein
VSTEALAEAFKVQNLGNASDKLLLIVIANYVGTEGTCFHAQKTFAEATNMSRRTILISMRRLEDAGYIRREQRDRRDGSRSTDLIHFTVPGFRSIGGADSAQGGAQPSRRGRAESAPLTTFEPTKLKEDTPYGVPSGAIDEEEDFSQSVPKANIIIPPKPAKRLYPKDDPEAFACFWAIYPKRQGKALAFTAWPGALAKIKGEERPGTYLIKKAQALADNLGDEAHFAPTPERWLRQERWDDELPARPKPPGAPVDRRRAENDQRVADMLSGGLDALNRRR